MLDRESSICILILSGVPQGTVLRLLMFLLYINNITKEVNLLLHLLADDCLFYRVINSVEDTNRLQENLNRLSEWANIWQLKFNVSKCTVICCTRSLTPLTHDYILNNCTLNVSDQHTYLGVIIHKSLSWSPHISDIVTKASRTLNIDLSKCSSQVKESAYLTMIRRPQIVYASDVWDPHHVGNIMEQEKIEQRAALWVLNDYGIFSSVTLMLDQLSWPTLQTHCKVSRLHTIIAQSVLSSVITYNSSILLTSNTTNETVSFTTLHLILFIYYGTPK